MYTPNRNIDNQYYTAFRVGQRVWYTTYTGVIQEARIVDVSREFNRKDRRNGIIFYWIGPVKPDHRSFGMKYRKWKFRNRTGFHHPGHGLSADELFYTRDMAVKTFQNWC